MDNGEKIVVNDTRGADKSKRPKAKLTTAQKVRQLEASIGELARAITAQAQTIAFHVNLFNILAELPTVKKELEALREAKEKEEKNKVVTPPSGIVTP